MNWLYDFLSENFVHALGWTVLHSLWQGLIIGLVLALAMMNTQAKSAEWRYRLSLGALLLMLVSSVGTFVFLLEKTNKTTPNDAFEALILRGPIFENSVLVEASFLEKTTLFFNENAPFIVIAWLLGVAFFSIRLIGGLLFIQQLRTQGLVFLESDWQNRVNVFKNKLKISRAVGIAESALVAVPMTLGWLKPLILLPIGTINNMTTGQVEAILAHELAHIAGHDYLLNILQSVVEIIFYFNPAVWWVSANIRAERENRCDDTAVSLSNNALTYAKALLSIQEMQRPDARLFGLTLTLADNRRKGFLLKRIKRILNQPHNRSHIMEKLTATGLLLAVVTALSFGSNKFLTQNSPTERPSSSLKSVIAPPSVPDPNLVLSEASNAVSGLISSISDVFGNDSLPKRRGKVSIQTDDHDGKAVKLEANDGKIIGLEVDGKSIPKEDFEKYRDLTDDILSNVPTPPMPPSPPSVGWDFPMPPAPPAPPAPPTRGWNIPMPPVPPVPPVPPLYFKKSKDAEGNTIIKMKKRDGKSSEIKITPDKKVFLNGKEVQEGDDVHLELGDTEGSDFQLIMPNLNYQWFNDDVTITTDDDSTRVFKINPKIKNRIRLKGDKSKPFYFSGDGFQYHFNNEEWRLRVDSMSREARKMAQLYRIDAGKIRQNALRLRQLNGLQQYNGQDRYGKSQTERLENELKKDGFLKEGKKKYKVELTNKTLKINDKEMSSEMHQRYLDLLASDSSGSFKITFEENNE
jgi:bla regulator protein blaR1